MRRTVMRRAVTRAAALLVTLIVVVTSGRTASAHDLKPGVLTLIALSDREYELRFIPPIDDRGEPAEITVVLPPGCTRTDSRVRCERALAGELAVLGMHGRAMRTLVAIEREDGVRDEWILSADAMRITLDAPPPRTALPWIVIGLEHIFGGPDHVAFVLGLLLVLEVALGRRLLLTISAFTLAHSLTLALAVLGVIAVSTLPVEACIAASVLLVAREATHREPTAIRRWPWLAAGGFGLVHGLGFAAALSEIGLPRASLAWSLVWFNVGVELGQLAVVVSAVVVVCLGRRLIGERRVVGPHVHRAACYALGGLAAYWLFDRVTALACG